MPVQNIKVLADVVPLEELCNEVAKLQKTLRYLLNGNLDFENVRVKGLTAETIDVNELSAISANLGTITAGLMQAVTILASSIYGSYIATANGTYPRAEMSNTNNLFAVYKDASNYVTMEGSSSSSGSPAINMVSAGAMLGQLYATAGKFYLTSELDMNIYASGAMLIDAFGGVEVGSFSRFRADDTGTSLQSALNAKANTFTGVSGTVYVSTTSGGPATTPITFSNGIRTS